MGFVRLMSGLMLFKISEKHLKIKKNMLFLSFHVVPNLCVLFLTWSTIIDIRWNVNAALLYTLKGNGNWTFKL